MKHNIKMENKWRARVDKELNKITEAQIQLFLNKRLKQEIDYIIGDTIKEEFSKKKIALKIRQAVIGITKLTDKDLIGLVVKDE